MTDRGQAAMAARAAYVLRANDAGRSTRAAPHLYPHQWSWDSAFVSVGIAYVEVERALVEHDSLVTGQWRTGMLPHIVFDPLETSYFPGPDRWAPELSPDAPGRPRTSGICQPPVHALTVERIVAIADARGGDDVEEVARWLPRIYAHLLAWHRYLAVRRDPDGTGLLTIYHPWESGLDNSPRWDAPYSRVVVDPDLPPYTRRDTTIVTDRSQRPTKAEYDRYLTGVEELKRAHYDDEAVRASSSFLVTDVLMSAIFAVANEALARLGERLGSPEPEELRAYAERSRAALAATVDARSGLALDEDLRTGERIDVQTVAGFAPLLCGGLSPEAERAMVELLRQPAWLGSPRLRYPVLPSTSPDAEVFDPRAYWRGPSWPVITWLFAWCLRLRGQHELAAGLRHGLLDQLAEGSLAEYYEPETGEPLGSSDQSWTAAAALDVTLGDDWDD